MIPAFDYRPAYYHIQDQIDDAVHRVLHSGRLILGQEVHAFEQEFAAFLGVPYAVGVNSGTDALIIALRTLGVGVEDEVITVANAGVPTIAAIRAVGARPRFVDVQPHTLLMDPDRIPEAISERTKAILPIHLYGQAVEMDAVLRISRDRGLRVIEDCAQAHGATYQGRRVGSFGDIGCFSFYPTKNLGAYGDGGLLVTQDRALEEQASMIRMYGFRNDAHAHCEGLNSRLDEMQAAILRVKLQYLTADNSARCEIAQQYLAGLSGADFQLPGTAPDREHVYHQFVIRSQDRQRLIEILEQHEIGFGIHYPEPLHLMEAYRFLGGISGDLPASEEACRSVLSLPIYPGLESSAIDQVLETLRAV